MGFGVNFPPLDFIAVLFILFSKNPFGALGIEKRGTYFFNSIYSAFSREVLIMSRKPGISV